jgi:D-beta-D-heptose 7-phosphate kinase/D-beta-D-heptose 1-phosphate adenosyltransferase
MNIVALGAKARVVGIIGDDIDGDCIKNIFQSSNVDTSYLFSSKYTSTITKTRVVSRGQQFIRIDKEIIEEPPIDVVNLIKGSIGDILRDITVIVISDYLKGFITEELAQLFITAGRENNIPIVIDPKGVTFEKYKGANVITPNTKEFCDLTAIHSCNDEKMIETIGMDVCEKHDIDCIILTRSEKGISTIIRGAGKSDFPTLAKEVIDVTGAGDTVVAMVALAYSAGFELSTCAILANQAASLVVSKFGVAQISLVELVSAYYMAEDDFVGNDADVVKLLKELKTLGKKIVFTNGCFDIIHAGHISSFAQAKKFGDVLVVGINSDTSIQRIKGELRPIINLENRKKILSAIKYIDFVIPFDEDTPQTLIEQISPDVLVKGLDWKGKPIAGSDFVLAHGGKVEYINMEDGLSTTNIINKILTSAERAHINKALFLDRDGIINEDTGFVIKTEDFVFRPGIFEFLSSVQALGFLLIIITNQSGIARGLYTEEDYNKLNDYMLRELSARGIRIDKVYHCPYHEIAHERYSAYEFDRKPHPGMILKAQHEFNIDLSKSVMVGDRPSDAGAALSAGIPHRYYLHTDYELDDNAVLISSLSELLGVLQKLCLENQI